MSRSGRRLAKVLVVAALVLGVTASTGSAASPARAPILGVVPHAGAFHGFAAAPPPPVNQCPPPQTPTQCNLDYLGGTVMHASTTYAIYWGPSGHNISGSYVSFVNQYFADVAAASSHADNVYSAATQYYDAAGPINYQSTFGGSYVDTATPFPSPSNCDDGVDLVCLTDADLQAEIQHVLTVKGWHGSTTAMFFVMTPDGVGSCFDSSNSQCTTNVYCAYHSSFADSSNEPVIYGNEPYDATIPGCDPGSSPNGDAADAAINTLSHEHNEAITDPFGDGWWNVDSGQENGDNCAWIFGSALGGTHNVDEYNQIINGHHYWLQEEWSNDGSACVQHYLGVPVSFRAPTVSGAAGQGHLISATPGVWSQSPTSYAYQWQRCAADGSSCANIPGATAATYTLAASDVGHTIRTAVSAHNGAGTAGFVQSAATALVVAVPAATAVPVLSGTAVVGNTLTTTAGAWNTQATFAYSWLRCNAAGIGCSAIAGATSATYVATTGDRGSTLVSRVAASNAAGNATALSTHTVVVVGVPAATKAPHITGRVRVGRKLSASRGSWSDSPTGYRYRWLRCNTHGGACAAIKGATHAKYKLAKRDARHRLRVRITATNAAGSKAATSRPTASVPR
jgi:hypothetical protein